MGLGVFGDQKRKVFFGTFSNLFKSSSENLGHCFWTKKAICGCIFYLQNSRIELENKDFYSKFQLCVTIERVLFDNFLGQKSQFWDFFKVVLALFSVCLGVIFGPKVPV